MILEFAPFELNIDRAELSGPDGLIALEPKTLALLRLLAENHERVLSKDEMIATVWGGRFVSDAAVSTVLKLVRKALGDDGTAQTYIRTVRGLGHRFVAPVRIRAPATVAAAGPVIEPRAQEDKRPTLAVLPFSQMGLASGFATLGDGLPAEIISSLARLRWLRVIARESSFRFRGPDVDLGGLKDVLGAGFCLSGRVEQFANRLIINVDLADTRSGSLVWSEHFERPLDDIHAVRAEIVSAVIAALDLQIPLAEAALARQKPVEHLDAWGAYHLGLSHMYRFNRHDNALAAGLFKRATDLDPGFASAFAARSFTSQQSAAMHYTSDRDANLRAARAEAERSHALDPFDPAANMAMGRLHLFDGRPEDGVMWLDRAVDLSPSFAKGHYSRAFLNVLSGRPDQTRSGIGIAMGLSPLDPMLAPMRMIRGLSYVVEGDYAAAADNAIQSMRMARTHYLGLLVCVAVCHLAGKAEATRYWAAVLRDLRPDAAVGDLARGIPFADAAVLQTLGGALRAMGLPD